MAEAFHSDQYEGLPRLSRVRGYGCGHIGLEFVDILTETIVAGQGAVPFILAGQTVNVNRLSDARISQGGFP